MALKSWIAQVFIINDDNQLIPKYNKKIKLCAEYDPQGINLRLHDGESCTHFIT